MPNKKTPPPPFSVADAQAVLNLARRAPLQNSDEADAARTILERFVAFVNAVVVK